ncbi:TPA: hypothetical protein LA460_000251 [Clostridium botulinum]|nr:hypothetical protein [Clostridium botulinum]HBJ1652855.1 hypothetical protein [Clostridium botulinum]
MAFENVNLWYAKDKNNKIVKIYDISEENRGDEYYCPICMSNVLPRLGDRIAHHFAHIDASKCTNESFIHFWVKNKLLEIGDIFKAKLSENNSLSFRCKDIQIEQEYRTDYGIYKPDITVITDTGKIIYFEIAYTNKKRIDKYYDRWSYLNNMVIEINAKELINGSESKEFKCVYYDNEIYNFQFKEYKNTSEFKTYEKNIFDTCEIKEAEDRLRKIDWFWQECIKRKMKKISDESFFDVIDCLNIEDRLYVIDKVLKTNCTDARWLYLFKKQKDIKDYINDFINNNKNECFYLNDIEVIDGKELVYRELFKKNFQIPYVKIIDKDKNLLFKFYSDYFDYNMTYVLDNLILEKTNYLNNKIKEINKIFEELYPLYNLNIKNIDNQYRNITIEVNYAENILFDFKVENIKKYDLLKNVTYKINNFRKSLDINFVFKNEIENYLDEKIEFLDTLNYINNEPIMLYVNNFRENERIIYLHIHNGYCYENKYTFIVINNEIRSPYGVNKFNNIDEFINIADALISNKVREIRYK